MPRHTNKSDTKSQEGVYGILFEYAADGMLILDHNGQVLDANPAMCRLLVLKKAEILQMNVRVLLPSIVWSNDIEGIRQQIQREERLIFETFIMRKSGASASIEVSVETASYMGQDLIICVCREIIPKQARHTVMRNISLYQTLFEQSNDAIFLLSLDGRHLMVNSSCAKMLGYSRNELIRMSIPDLVVPEELDHTYKCLEQLRRGERLPPYERRMRRKDGSIISVELNVTVVRDAIGNPICIQSIARDITEAKRAKRSIAEKDQMLMTLYEFLNQGVAYRDRQNRLVLANPAFERITGRTLKQLRGEEPDPFDWDRRRADGTPLPDEERPSSVVLRTKQPVKDFLMSLYNPQMKSHRWIIVNAIPLIMTGESEPYGVVLLLDDVTERREMLQALTENEQRYRLLAENALDIIFRYQYYPTPKFEYVSPSATRIVGYTPDEHYADPELGLKIVYPEDRSLLLNLPDMITPDGMKYTIRWIHKNGHVVWVEQSLVPVYDNSGRLVAVEGIARDISEEKRTENELKHSNMMLELYASLLRHDLRNDLQVIMTQADMVLAGRHETTEYITALTAIIATVKRMTSLLNMLNNPSSIMLTDLQAVIEHSAVAAEKSYPGLRIIIKYDTAVFKSRLTCTQLLTVVLDNLFRNAAAYAGPNSIVHLTVRQDEKKVVIDVADDGPGIPPSIRSILFQRGASTTGSGYGLYLSRKIVEAYGGTIELLESKRGACFRIQMPTM